MFLSVFTQIQFWRKKAVMSEIEQAVPDEFLFYSSNQSQMGKAQKWLVVSIN